MDQKEPSINTMEINGFHRSWNDTDEGTKTGRVAGVSSMLILSVIQLSLFSTQPEKEE
jgi:hypothetical protein